MKENKKKKNVFFFSLFYVNNIKPIECIRRQMLTNILVIKM